MLIIESYKDLLDEVESLGWLLDDVKRQLQKNKGDVWGHTTPLPKALAQYDNIIGRMRALELAIDEKKLLAKRIEEKLLKFTGIQYTIAYLRDIKGMNLKEISVETGYEYGYIRKLNSEMKKEKEQRLNSVLAK